VTASRSRVQHPAHALFRRLHLLSTQQTQPFQRLPDRSLLRHGRGFSPTSMAAEEAASKDRVPTQSRLLDARSCGGDARQYYPSAWLFEKDSDRALTCRFVADVIAIGAATHRHAFVLSVALFFHFILSNVDHGDSRRLACDEAKGGEGNNED